MLPEDFGFMQAHWHITSMCQAHWATLLPSPDPHGAKLSHLAQVAAMVLQLKGNLR